MPAIIEAMMAMDNTEERIAAVLHDVVADRVRTLDNLRARKIFLRTLSKPSRRLLAKKVRIISTTFGQIRLNPMARRIVAEVNELSFEPDIGLAGRFVRHNLS